MGSHRDLGVLYTHPLEYGTIRPLYLYEEQAASSIQLCTQRWKKKSGATKYRLPEQFICLESV